MLRRGGVVAERTLYITPLSPFCRKVRLLLKEKRLSFEVKDEPVWEQREEFFKLNPAGEVPVLVDENGLTISGSYAIVEYLEEGYENSNFLGSTLAERAEIRRLTTWFDMKFYQEVSQIILFERVFRRLVGGGQPDSDMIREARRNIHYHLDYIAYLKRNRTWLGGEFMSVADFAAAAHISVLDYLGDIDWADVPEVREWYALIKSRPSFRPLLADRVRGFRPPSHYDNPDF